MDDKPIISKATMRRLLIVGVYAGIVLAVLIGVGLIGLTLYMAHVLLGEKLAGILIVAVFLVVMVAIPTVGIVEVEKGEDIARWVDSKLPKEKRKPDEGAD